MILEFLKNASEFWWLGIFSVVTFFLTIMILPLIILHLPEDYFAREKPDGCISRQVRGVRFTLLILKNMGGFLLLLTGVLMLFIPGQGILTILAGLSVMNFPGKRKMEIKLASKNTVFKSLNWIRTKGHRAHFQMAEFMNSAKIID